MKLLQDTLHPRRKLLGGVPALMMLALAAPAARAQATKQKPYRLVLQVSDADPAKWGLALNNASNVQAEFGADNVDVEIVAYGPGIGMFKKDAPVGGRIAAAIKSGVRMAACQNTMHAMKLSPADMLPDLQYVPSGVGELVVKQQQGWAYVRP